MIESTPGITAVQELAAQAEALEAQRAALNEQLQAARNAARAEAIAAAQTLIGNFALTADDLTLHRAQAGKRTGKRTGKPGRGSCPPKYRSPDGTSTWSGRGKRPTWFTAALAAGVAANSMLIQQAA